MLLLIMFHKIKTTDRRWVDSTWCLKLLLRSSGDCSSSNIWLTDESVHLDIGFLRQLLHTLCREIKMKRPRFTHSKAQNINTSAATYFLFCKSLGNLKSKSFDYIERFLIVTVRSPVHDSLARFEQRPHYSKPTCHVVDDRFNGWRIWLDVITVP